MSAPEDLKTLEAELPFRFRNKALLREALTHSSYLNEHPEERAESNERLAFLGDAVLQFVISEQLYRDSRDQAGELSERRQGLIDRRKCREVGRRLQLHRFLRLGKGATQRSDSPRILEGTYEALVAAVFLDSDYETVARFVRSVHLP